ncbi:Basic-leucine zipper domain-containing protein [Aphelenchoides fujianensis]|nr:Basic-leucine zipper domain-containing protein [Aphelenchoides fujianensis]
MSCALLSAPSSRGLFRTLREDRGLLEAEERTIDRPRRHAFCAPSSTAEAAAESACCSPTRLPSTSPSSSSSSSSCSWSSAASTQHSASSSCASTVASCFQPLTPCSSNGSESSASPSAFCGGGHPLLPPADSPQSPLFWAVTSYVAEECDWRDFLDEIIEDVRAEIRSENVFNSHFAPQSSTTRPLKRKLPTSAESTASSSSDGEAADVPPASASGKRAKKYSLSALTHEQIAERKKEQNRIAAQRYRSRRNQTLEEGRNEIAFLEQRNADLRLETAQLEEEIRQLKALLVGDSGC